MNSCRCEELRSPGGFSDFPEFDSFKLNIEKNDILEASVVAKIFSDVGGLNENWFKCQICGRTWRLVEPDPPFRGMWAKVDD